MNAQLANLLPLPVALQSPAWDLPYHPIRRQLVGDFPIRAQALARFNRLLVMLHHFPLDCDQIATASRELADRSAGEHGAASILQRLRMADTVEQMVADPAWQPANEAVAPARVVATYVHGHHELIPDQAPPINRLDDAILADAAWLQLANEVDSYLDYCRLRAIEAELRGCGVGEFAFSRGDWQEAHRAEAALLAHVRRVGQSSYLSQEAPARFRVH